MVFAVVHSAMIVGPTAQPIRVEVESTRAALPRVSIVGLAQASVVESKERVFAALRSARVSLPMARVTLSLVPVMVPKSGTSLDIALALALMVVHGVIPSNDYAAVGELTLDGNIVPSAAAWALAAALEEQHKRVFVPATQLQEALRYARRPEHWYPVSSLAELITGVTGQHELAPLSTVAHSAAPALTPAAAGSLEGVSPDVVTGMELAIAGGHHVLFTGSPGVGKSYVAEMLPSIMPPEAPDEARERLLRENIRGESWGRVILPHHSVTAAGLLGGGSPLRAGLVTLAHNGILFLDELPEFRPEALESLRQPLEREAVTLVRAGISWTVPCSCTVIATANPCPCGFYGMKRRCRCTREMRLRYWSRISGPVRDRFAVECRVLNGRYEPVDISDVCRRIERARHIQARRHEMLGFAVWARNYTLTELAQCCGVIGEKVVRSARLRWRQRLKVLRVARTLADLDSNAQVHSEHVHQAMVLTQALPKSR